MLSVCAICKNEISNVAEFLESWLRVADEIVIVDTGSTDGTAKFLNDYATRCDKLRVYSMAWNNDFSAARNYATSMAVGTWILWADLDDRLSDDCVTYLKYKELHDNNVYAFQIASDVGDGNWHRFMQVRLFPNLPSMRFEKKIHENLEGAITRNQMDVVPLPDVVVGHFGYTTPEIRKQKAIRNLEILSESEPKDAAEFAQIGDALYSLEKYFVGLGYYAEAVRLGGELAKRNLAERLCMGYLHVGMLEKAGETISWMKPDSVERRFWNAELARANGDIDGAIAIYGTVKFGKSDLSGRESTADALIAKAAARIKEWGEQCSLA